MGRFIDLTNRQFGYLKVIRKYKCINKQWRWWCQCICGKKKLVAGVHLRTGYATSCGCGRLRNICKKYIGRRFGHAVIVGLAGHRKKRIYWKFRCDCGNTFTYASHKWMGRKPMSCGCMAIKSMIGRRFHWLKIIAYKGVRIWGKDNTRHWRKWLCRCVCGKELVTTTWLLTSGSRKSCGCKNKKRGPKPK